MQAKPYLREISISADAEFDEEEYPFSIPAVRQMGTIVPHPDVTFFVGENGAGKSTILEAIAVGLGFAAEGGTRDVYREEQATSSLQHCLKLVKSFRKPSDSFFLRAESLFNVASYYESVGSSSRGQLHQQILSLLCLPVPPSGQHAIRKPRIIEQQAANWYVLCRCPPVGYSTR